jgi:cation-transporting ATPase 13A1
MQMAMAVNMALMALIKGGIFCTEPFRVPLAGKISHCFFDKTGTLTTDQLVPVGVINASNPLFKYSDVDDSTIPSLSKVVDASGVTAIILAACHSLVQIDTGNDKDKQENNSNLVGDPIELAAMKGVEWRWEATTSTAKPGIWHIQERAISFLKKKIIELNSVAVVSRKLDHATSLIEIEKQIKELNEKIFLAKEKSSYAMFNAVQVITRHHFSSKLQRMSVVCKCDSNGEAEWYCLVKGSPEIIKSLLVKNDAPEWYDKTYDKLARSGLRVLALAYKKIIKPLQYEEPSRAFVESELHFAGFISFECKIRADSNVVIRALKESDHSVAMLTGDALLTSLHVAIQTGICNKNNNTYTLHSSDNNNIDPYWVDRDIDGNEKKIKFSPDNIQQLGENYELLTTEADFVAVAESTGVITFYIIINIYIYY